jgi:acetoin utilization deacetylase AcuC-like enzyme
MGPPLPDAGARAFLIDDRRFDLHVAPGHHPERPERLVAARAGLGRAQGRFDPVDTRMATDEELARVHDPAFIERLEKLRGQRAYLDPDTYLSPESVDTARLAAGSLVAMVDALLAEGAPTAVSTRAGSTTRAITKGVALLRPPGHHARRAQAMGFCLLNNVAVAAAHARARGIARVAVVDWDVHHGNGTQEMFWRDPGVMYVSTHQFPFYPGTGAVDEIGEGDGTGYTVNLPLAAGGGDAIYASAFERVVLPVLEAYAPELVLVSAGFDAAARDPLAQMELTSAAFGWMARELARVADRSAGGRMALVLEGGYDLVALEAGIARSIEGMLDGRSPEVPRSPDDEGVERAARSARKAWPTVT